jgi:CheY-like chemotaxis protein
MRIINDLLDLSKIEAGKWHVESLPFDPVEVARDVVSLLLPVAQDKGLVFDDEFPDGPQRILLGDANRLRQILLNLLDNAIKFTEQGGVRLRVFITPEADGSQRLICEVSDTGIGMSDQVLNQLFKPFYQGDASMSRRFGGTGLGLSICRRMAELMGGHLRVESTLGQGSRFELSLHLPVASAQSALSPDGQGEASDLPGVQAGLRVLLVEDNPVNQKVAQALLKRLGCVVWHASNGLEALDALQSHPVDLVLMDCQMPQMDGLEATRRIREGQAGEPVRHIPIVAMTAHAMQGDREKCLMVGMNEYLTKPVRMSELQLCLTTVMGPVPQRSR